MKRKTLIHFSRVLCAIIPVFLLLLSAGSRSAAFAAEEFPAGPSVCRQLVIRFNAEDRVFYDPFEGKSAILSYTCELPYVVSEVAPAVAEKINTVLNAYNSQFVMSADGIDVEMDRESYLLSVAEDLYSLRSESGAGAFLISFSHRCSVSRCDGRVLVLSFSDYYDDSENISMTSETLCFDLITGDRITDAQAANLPSGLDQTSDICFCGLFTEEEFASESFSFDGKSSEAFAVTDLLETELEGKGFFLCFAGEARNVRISRVVYYDQCYEKQQLWYCSHMENEALQILTGVPEENPMLKLYYESNGVPVEKVLASDGNGGLRIADP